MEVVQNFLDVPELRIDEIFLHEFAGVGVLVQLGPHVLGVLPEKWSSILNVVFAICVFLNPPDWPKNKISNEDRR